MKKTALLLLLLPLYAGAAAAFDFGVVLDQTAGAGGIGDDSAFDYEVSLVSYFSSPISDSGDLFISSGLTAGYKDEEGFFAPELLRTEFSWRFNDALRLSAGRLSYAAPLSFVLDGLLDGAQVAYNTAMGTFNAGSWYSGLIYKETTRIIMTARDFFAYYDDDFYAASRRMLMTAGWEHPALMELVRLRASVIMQFDVNGEDDPYHSQYIALKAGVPFQRFVFELGGVLQIAQDKQEEGESGAALAGEIGVSWEPPTPFQSQISFNGRFSSGRKEDGSIVAFVPITIQDQGSVLKANLSGISALGLDYTARIVQDLSAGLAFTYFTRSDLGTYFGYPVYMDDKEGYTLGGELFGRVIWSPFSDLRLSAGAGFFAPGMGNVAPDADPQWRMELNVILAIY